MVRFGVDGVLERRRILLFTIDLIQRAAGDPDVQILSSVRDIPPGREDPVSGGNNRLSLAVLGTNLLETRKRAILIPHPVRYDQPCRAQRFGELGLFRTLTAAEVDPPRLADTIRDTLAGPAPYHQYDLNGAANTCELLAEPMPAEA